jgi:hypothetical protein
MKHVFQIHKQFMWKVLDKYIFWTIISLNKYIVISGTGGIFRGAPGRRGAQFGNNCIRRYSEYSKIFLITKFMLENKNNSRGV